MAGNVSASSLLSSATARRNKIQEQEDALIAFEYDMSAKTYGDFVSYSNYLQERAKNTTDPSKNLSYQKAIVSARKGYTSNEIQRANIDIIEGRGNNNTKYDKLVDLFYQALDNGDYDLAQGLNLQLDNLSVKIQQEAQAQAEAQQRAYSSAAAAGAKSVAKLVSDLEKGVTDITLANGKKVTPLAAISEDLKKNGFDTATWAAAGETINALRNLLIDQYNGATSQDQIDALEQKYGAGLENIDSSLKFNFGGKSLTAQDISIAAQNEAINNPIYSMKAKFNEATGKTEYTLKENSVDRAEYTRQIDSSGNEYYAPTQVRTDQDKLFFGNSDQGRGLGTQITSSGEIIGDKGQINQDTGKVKRDDSQSIGNRLKSFGIDVKQNGTTLTISLPGESVEREATIQPDGSIRYFTDDGQLAEIGVVDRNLGSNDVPYLSKAGEQRIVDATETSDFGQASAFGGLLSQASEQGRNYVRDFTTNSDVRNMSPTDLRTARLTGVANPTNPGIAIGNNFSGVGSPLTSNILQSAGFTQGNIQKERFAAIQLQAQQEAAQKLQAAQVFNLNQTPVAQFANNGALKKQLKVEPLPAPPRVYVAAPAPTPKVTVSSAPGNQGGVNYSGTLKVR